MSTTSTVKLQNAVETIDNLNLNTQSMNATIDVPGESDGLYAMINKMMSDLASIKAAIKVEEKNISADIRAHFKRLVGETDDVGSDTATLNDALDLGTVNVLSTVATLSLNAGLGSGTNRHTTDPGTKTNTLPAVYVTKIGSTTRAYSEDAVFGILANAAEIIKKLKSGKITSTGAGATTPLAANVATVQIHS